MSLKHCTVATLTYYAICYSTVHFNSIPILQGPGTLEQCTKTEGSCTLQQYPIIQCRWKQLTLLCIVLERCDCILYFCTGSVVTIVSFTLCKVLILCNCILYCIVLVLLTAYFIGPSPCITTIGHYVTAYCLIHWSSPNETLSFHAIFCDIIEVSCIPSVCSYF